MTIKKGEGSFDLTTLARKSIQLDRRRDFFSLLRFSKGKFALGGSCCQAASVYSLTV